MPVLWVHGEADQLAAYDSAKVLVEKVAPNLEAHSYEGAAHEVFNETNSDEVIGTVAAFLAKNA
jgi:alpha-beta hydrolase superfamily lysophospholipase